MGVLKAAKIQRKTPRDFKNICPGASYRYILRSIYNPLTSTAGLCILRRIRYNIIPQAYNSVHAYTCLDAFLRTDQQSHSHQWWNKQRTASHLYALVYEHTVSSYNMIWYVRSHNAEPRSEKNQNTSQPWVWTPESGWTHEVAGRAGIKAINSLPSFSRRLPTQAVAVGNIRVSRQSYGYG